MCAIWKTYILHAGSRLPIPVLCTYAAAVVAAGAAVTAAATVATAAAAGLPTWFGRGGFWRHMLINIRLLKISKSQKLFFWASDLKKSKQSFLKISAVAYKMGQIKKIEAHYTKHVPI